MSSGNMIHYVAIFSVNDEKHIAHGWSQDIKTATKHFDGHVLNRRRAMIPEETTKLIKIWEVKPQDVDRILEEEKAKLDAENPNREGAENQFDTPNRILENPVTVTETETEAEAE